MEYVPVIDLSKISEPSEISDIDLASTAELIYKALSGIGFAYLSNHGIKQDIIDNAFATSKQFFELPQLEKDKSQINTEKSYNGYASAKRTQETGRGYYAARESYDLLCGNSRYYPENPEEFGPALIALEESCKPLVNNLLMVFALALNLEDKEYFVKRSKGLEDPNFQNLSTIRSIYYPKISGNISAETVRCGRHTDYGMLTLLFQDNIGGLQVKSVSGNWVPANPIPGTILLNTGDLLERWSGGKFPATEHQVLIPEEEIKKRTYRQSIVYFVHPDDNVKISPLTGTGNYAIGSAKELAKMKLKSAYD